MSRFPSLLAAVCARLYRSSGFFHSLARARATVMSVEYSTSAAKKLESQTASTRMAFFGPAGSNLTLVNGSSQMSLEGSISIERVAAVRGTLGPIDDEISIPEFVLQGDLSPHQDYVYFSAPTAEEQKSLADFRHPLIHSRTSFLETGSLQQH